MSTKYQVVDSRDQVHIRTTQDRTYTHAVVYHIPARAAGDPAPHFLAREAHSKAAWCGSRALAEKEARSLGKHYKVEIIEAQVVDKRATVKA